MISESDGEEGVEGVSLAEFTAIRSQPASAAWGNSLPDEIKKQILASTNAGDRMVAQWLHSLGYKEATDSKIAYFRRINR